MAPRKRVLTPGASTAKRGRPKKVETELEREERISKARSEAGKKGGKARQIQQREQSATAQAKWDRGEEMTEAECRRLELDLLEGVNAAYEGKPEHEQTNRHRDVAAITHGAYMHLEGKEQREAWTKRKIDFVIKLTNAIWQHINLYVALDDGPVTREERNRDLLAYHDKERAFAYWLATRSLPDDLVPIACANISERRQRKAIKDRHKRARAAGLIWNAYTGSWHLLRETTEAEENLLRELSKLHDESRWLGKDGGIGFEPFGPCPEYGFQEYPVYGKNGVRFRTTFPLDAAQREAKKQVRKELQKAGLLTPAKRGAETPDQTFDGPPAPLSPQFEETFAKLFDEPLEII